MLDPRVARVVKVKVADGAGEATIGSGFLVAPGLVLTARHVLEGDDAPKPGGYPAGSLRVRAAAGPCAGRSVRVVRVVVLGEAAGVDVAALVVPDLVPVAGTGVVGVRFGGSGLVPGCSMIGYLRAAHRDGTVGPEHVGVSVLPVSGTGSGRLAVQVTTPPVREDADWKGLSGSGVVDARNRLVGVLTAVQVQWHQRLAVVPVKAIVEAARDLVGQYSGLEPLLDVAVLEEEDGVDLLLDHTKFPSRLTDLGDESLFEALHFRNRVVGFVEAGGRGSRVEEILDWVRAVGDRPDVRVGVVTGRAGVGKSRLAAQVCDRLMVSDRWWRAGFADHAKLPAAPVPAVPTVVVIDYPEREPEAVGTFVASVHAARREGLLQAPVRVLLVARDERSWFERARARCSNQDMLVTIRTELSAVEFDDAVRAEHAEAAYAAFCNGFGLPAPDRPPFWPGPGSGWDRPLPVHAAALLAAWHLYRTGPDQDRPTPTSTQISNEGRARPALRRATPVYDGLDRHAGGRRRVGRAAAAQKS